MHPWVAEQKLRLLCYKSVNPEIENVSDDFPLISMDGISLSSTEINNLPCDTKSIKGGPCFMSAATLVVARTMLHAIEDTRIRQFVVDAHASKLSDAFGNTNPDNELQCPRLPQEVRELYFKSMKYYNKMFKKGAVVVHMYENVKQESFSMSEDRFTKDNDALSGTTGCFLSAILWAGTGNKHIMLEPTLKRYPFTGHNFVPLPKFNKLPRHCNTVLYSTQFKFASHISTAPTHYPLKKVPERMNEHMVLARSKGWNVLAIVLASDEHGYCAFPCENTWIFCNNYGEECKKIDGILEEFANHEDRVLDIEILYARTTWF